MEFEADFFNRIGQNRTVRPSLNPANSCTDRALNRGAPVSEGQQKSNGCSAPPSQQNAKYDHERGRFTRHMRMPTTPTSSNGTPKLSHDSRS